MLMVLQVLMTVWFGVSIIVLVLMILLMAMLGLESVLLMVLSMLEWCPSLGVYSCQCCLCVGSTHIRSAAEQVTTVSGNLALKVMWPHGTLGAGVRPSHTLFKVRNQSLKGLSGSHSQGLGLGAHPGHLVPAWGAQQGTRQLLTCSAGLLRTRICGKWRMNGLSSFQRGYQFTSSSGVTAQLQDVT